MSIPVGLFDKSFSMERNSWFCTNGSYKEKSGLSKYFSIHCDRVGLPCSSAHCSWNCIKLNSLDCLAGEVWLRFRLDGVLLRFPVAPLLVRSRDPRAEGGSATVSAEKLPISPVCSGLDNEERNCVPPLAGSCAVEMTVQHNTRPPPFEYSDLSINTKVTRWLSRMAPASLFLYGHSAQLVPRLGPFPLNMHQSDLAVRGGRSWGCKVIPLCSILPRCKMFWELVLAAFQTLFG